jgi:hypothetical protein
LVPYYTALGYRIISNQASYLRGTKIQIDNDPVMLLPNNHDIPIEMHRQLIFFGLDF